ncbi:O-antigen ligase [Paenibacillus sp. J45TS6]|uniref:O-antigen ligase family protein n=1 Tax=Paenibacillus sp. J45TS6 TaxID=2807196 RepID=UPI001BCDC180|nr:hypothetical protein [Paenibacillus sp. J45TS6]
MSIAAYNPVIFGLNLSNIILIIGFIYILLVRNVKTKMFHYKKTNVMLIILLYVYLSTTIIYSIDQLVSIITYVKIITPILFSVVLMNTITTLRKMEFFLGLLISSGYISAIYGCVQYFFGLTDYRLVAINGELLYRATGTFQHANVYGSYLILILPFMIYKFSHAESQKNKLIHSLLILITHIAIYLSFSRWAIICLLIVYVLFGIRTIINSLKFKKLPRWIILIPIIISTAVYVVYSNWGTIDLLFIDRGSNDIRYNSLNITITSFFDNMKGFGLGNGNGGLILDGTYFNLLVDAGFVGLLLYCILIFHILIGLKKKYSSCISLSNLYLISNLSLLLFVLNGFLETNIYNTGLNIFLGLYIYLLNIDKDIFNKTSINVFEADMTSNIQQVSIPLNS